MYTRLDAGGEAGDLCPRGYAGLNELQCGPGMGPKVQVCEGLAELSVLDKC